MVTLHRVETVKAAEPQSSAVKVEAH